MIDAKANFIYSNYKSDEIISLIYRIDRDSFENYYNGLILRSLFRTEQRFGAWRRRGFLPLNFLRSTNVHIYEKLSNEELNPRLRQIDVGSWAFLCPCNILVAIAISKFLIVFLFLQLIVDYSEK